MLYTAIYTQPSMPSMLLGRKMKYLIYIEPELPIQKKIIIMIMIIISSINSTDISYL